MKLKRAAADIKLSHTVFALPFALLSMVMAACWAHRLPTVVEGLLILVCMVLARTMAMAVNRWADASLDALNPRTAGRAIPSGDLSQRFMGGLAWSSGGLFIAATSGFYFVYANPWPWILSPMVVIYLAGYSFTKRFTSLCHLYLGLALALSPLAAAIAIEPGYLSQAPVWWLVLLVTTWVAGFDILYALQDVAVDREHRLFSLPSRLGTARALWISRGLHGTVLGALLALNLANPQLGIAFALASVATAALLAWEHVLVWNSQTHHLHLAFFTLNGLISLLLGAAGIVDLWT